MKKIIKKMLRAALVGFLASGFIQNAAYADSPSYGATVRDRIVSLDGNGHEMRLGSSGDIGWKVWQTTGTAAIQVKDEAGKAPTSGILHMVCISTGTGGQPADFALYADSAGAAGFSSSSFAGNSGGPLGPAVVSSSTAHVCITLDAQFNYGLVMKNSSAATWSYAYWRPIGGRN